MLNITRKVTNIFHRQGEYLHLNYRLMQYLLTEKKPKEIPVIAQNLRPRMENYTSATSQKVHFLSDSQDCKH